MKDLTPKLNGISIAGYKVFKELTTFRISPSGVTCIVGKNNTGKTSVLNAILAVQRSGNFPDRQRFYPGEFKDLDESALIEGFPLKIDLGFEIQDFKSTFPELHNFFENCAFRPHDEFNENTALAHNLRVAFLSKLTLRFEFELMREGNRKNLYLMAVKVNNFELLGPNLWNDPYVLKWARTNRTNHFNRIGNTIGGLTLNTTSSISMIFEYFANFLKSVHQISPDRQIPAQIGQRKIEQKIDPNLNQVPALLSYWKESERLKFNKVIKFLNSVDESIGDMRFPPDGVNGEATVKFANHRDEDKAIITLANSGTGISQLLGMATYLVSNENKFFIIDEPQSFLHPKAELELLKLMLQSSHQIIVATHSSAFINANRNALVVLTKNNGVTTALNVSKESQGNNELRTIASDLGVPANHLLAGAGILWVEGPTEVSVINVLRNLDSDFDLSLLGVNVIPLKNTGDIAGVRTRRISSDIQKVLASQIGIKSVIVLDNEKLEEKDIAELETMYGKGLHFLGQHEIEYFFLNPEVVNELFQQISSDLGNTYEKTATDIENHFAENVKQSPSNKIKKCMWDFIKVGYDKVKHGPQLVTISVEHDKESLREAKEAFIRALTTLHSP